MVEITLIRNTSTKEYELTFHYRRTFFEVKSTNPVDVEEKFDRLVMQLNLPEYVIWWKGNK